VQDGGNNCIALKCYYSPAVARFSQMMFFFGHRKATLPCTSLA